MYLETLQTPHANREPWQVETSQALSDVVFDSGLDTLPETPDRHLWAAAAVQQAIRRSLWYEPGVSLEALSETQMATCIGYTVVGSEALEAAGVDHWVGFANGHAVLLLPDRNNLWLLDMLSPELNQPIDRALSYGTKQSISEDLNNHGRAVVKLHTEVLAGTLHKTPEDIAQTHPWFLVDTSKTRRDRLFPGVSHENERRQRYSRQSLILSVFEPKNGRNVLAEYSTFRESMDSGQYKNATKSLRELAGFYPDIDARGDSFKLVKRLVGRLSRAGDIASAKTVVSDFFSSFSISGDTRVREYEGDCLRVIAEAGNDIDAALQAFERYNSVRRNPRSYGCVAAKATIALDIAKQLDHRGEV